MLAVAVVAVREWVSNSNARVRQDNYLRGAHPEYQEAREQERKQSQPGSVAAGGATIAATGDTGTATSTCDSSSPSADCG